MIRIASTWGLFALISISLGGIKSALDEKGMTFEKYMKMNIGNVISYAFYFTLQDASLVVATALLNPSFSSALKAVSTAGGIFFALIILLYILWAFNIINFPDP